MREFLSKIALVSAIFFFYMPAAGQDIDAAVEQMAEDGATDSDIEDYVQRMEALASRPLNLNAASREQLESCGLFNPFQTASLLDYRKEYGALLSMAELALVDGFSAEFAARIAPYVTLEGGGGGVPPRTLQLRSRYKWKGDVKGLAQYNRLLLEQGDVKAGLLSESDAGEKPLVDYVGGYLSVKKGRLEALAGDYNACFGQGLALWNAFSFTSAAAPSALLRRAKGVTPYKSADETRALRGLAVGLEAGRWRFSLISSAAGVDARQGPDGYTSLPVTGYHRTIAEKAAKNSMREYILGGNATRRGERWQAGLTAVAYTYNKPNARKVTGYNQFQMYDGWHGNLSADFIYSAGHWRLFAEGALDSGLRPAAVGGVSLTASYNFEAAALVRYYDKAYIAPHAGAYSTISTVANQYGAVLSLLMRPLRGLLVTSFTEAVRYPAERYRIGAWTSAFYEKLKAEYETGGFTFTAQDNFVWQSYDSSRKHSLRGVIKWESGTWKASVKCGAVSLRRDGKLLSGRAAALQAQRSFWRERLLVSASLSFYSSPDYDTRVYLSQSDLPGSFSLQYYYGKGIAAKGLVRLKTRRKTSVTAVVAAGACPECRFQADINF